MARSEPAVRNPVEGLESRRLLAAGFQISLVFSADLLEPEYESYQSSFITAAARWTAILTEDIPDVGSGPWGGAVDDIRIEAAGVAIDGPGQVLGSAQYQYRRTTGARLPINGVMEFDTADLNNATIVDVITHEMGHVLGIGSLWSGASLVNDYGGTNPQFNGAAALAEYRAMMANPSLTSIPVENTGPTGTRDVHWRESTFARELMTGYYQSGQVNPLSRMSAASLIDVGYPGVNLDATNAYAPAGGNPAPLIASVSPSSATSSIGSTVTFTANNVTDSIGGTANVRFYRESNGIPGLQASGNVTVKDTLVGTASSGAPWSVSVALGSLPAGTYTYYAQGTDVHGATSVYVSTNHTVTVGPAAPSTPDLDASSDSGLSSTDNVTNDSTPTFRGTSAEPGGSTVRIFADGLEIGQTTVGGDGTWTFTAAGGLGDGVRSISAKVETAGGLSPASGALAITIDTASPQVVSSAFIYSVMLGVQFQFNEDVTASLGSGDVSFSNTSTSATLPAVYVGSAGSVATFRFSVTIPPNGNYVATLGGAGVTDLAGNALIGNPTVSFFYLLGDIDRSRAVDFDDLLIVAQHYGQTGTFADGDIDYSGNIGFNDLLLLAQNFGQSLVMQVRPTALPKKRSAGIFI